jgi:fatty acid-binding protein DegV
VAVVDSLSTGMGLGFVALHARGTDLAAEAAGESEVDIAVHHLAAPARAAELTEALTQRLGGRIRSCYQTEIGAAVGAHVGPGLASVVVHSRSNG